MIEYSRDNLRILNGCSESGDLVPENVPGLYATSCSKQCETGFDTYIENEEAVFETPSNDGLDKTEPICYNYENNIWDGYDMSALVMGAKQNNIFCLSDSYSLDVKGNVASSNWKKMTLLPERNMIISVCGENTIYSTNIIDVVEKMSGDHLPSFTSSDDNTQFLQNVAKWFLHHKTGGNSIIILAGYYKNDENGVLLPVIQRYIISPTGIQTETFGNNQNVYGGADCFMNIVNRNVRISTSYDITVDNYTRIIEHLIDLNSLLLLPVIGGDIQKLEIKPI